MDWETSATAHCVITIDSLSEIFTGERTVINGPRHDLHSEIYYIEGLTGLHFIMELRRPDPEGRKRSKWVIKTTNQKSALYFHTESCGCSDGEASGEGF